MIAGVVGGGSGGGGSWLGLGPGRVVWLEKGSLCWRKQSVGVVAVEACVSWGVSGGVVTEPGQQDRIEAALVRLFPRKPR